MLSTLCATECRLSHQSSNAELAPPWASIRMQAMTKPENLFAKYTVTS